jgi:hypothetical protein
VPGHRVGFMPQELALYSEFSIGETLSYFGRIFNMTAEKIRERTLFLIDFLDLPKDNRLVSILCVSFRPKNVISHFFILHSFLDKVFLLKTADKKYGLNCSVLIAPNGQKAQIFTHVIIIVRKIRPKTIRKIDPRSASCPAASSAGPRWRRPCCTSQVCTGLGPIL